MRAFVLASLAVIASVAPAIADGATEETVFLVGRTNIFCVKAPCPWRGIAPAGGAAGPHALIWSGDALPEVDGDPADVASISQAWNNGDCLVVRGQFTAEVLTVDAVVGPCP
ncbi:hypothetical protein SAMN06295905_0555 [Devosia lucknowensis]|uniref:DUF5666 domain-containing protein n=1 Tax=Devosia lucknowensis TaxID=1096929 RepID=A0A1Y6EH24_9HYPH|nr:hypothetical protein [Devosia lucknowensis]SMQ61679.1 hypothetical protein SAMN06295905_0555 [Devosia lucknowensis]